MRRGRLVLGGLLLALAVLGVAPGIARADEYETAMLDHATGSTDTYRVRARVLGTPGTNRAGGYGYVRVEVINPSDKAHTVEIRLDPSGYGSVGRCSFRRTLSVEAQGRTSLDLPLLGSAWGGQMRFVLDGRPAPDTVHVGGGRTGRGARLAALLVTSDPDAAPWQTYLDAQGARRGMGPRFSTVVAARAAEELPSAWVHLSAFDLVLVDARTAGLTAERQILLLQYAAGGGNLVVFGVGPGASGPLADLRRGREALETEPAQGHHGLGRWIVFPGAVDGTSPQLGAWLDEGSGEQIGAFGRMRHPTAGGGPPAMWWPLQIPGLGEVPAKTFFLLILLFVLLVGPVSYIYFRRRRRLAMLLVTIPLFGFVWTALILGYGLFSEGFGIIAAERSFTVLDQETHEAASAAGRTLYAGLQPSALTASAGTWVASTGFDTDVGGDTTSRSWHVDLDGGFRLGGGALPSRTPTAFVSVTVGRSRERLRFRHRADGGYDVLATADFRPVEKAGAVLLRTPDGAYYVSTAGEVLQPVVLGDALRATTIADLLQEASAMPLGAGEAITEDYYGGSPRWMNRADVGARAAGTVTLGRWIAVRLERMPKGSYLARVNRAPLVETLGLEVETRAAEHVVLGLLGPEDVIDE